MYVTYQIQAVFSVAVTNQSIFIVLVLFVRDTETKKLQEFRFPAEEEFEADNLKKWIRRNSGIYLPLPGCLEEFDLLADKLMEASRFHLELELRGRP